MWLLKLVSLDIWKQLKILTKTPTIPRLVDIVTSHVLVAGQHAKSSNKGTRYDQVILFLNNLKIMFVWFI